VPITVLENFDKLNYLGIINGKIVTSLLFVTFFSSQVVMADCNANAKYSDLIDCIVNENASDDYNYEEPDTDFLAANDVKKNDVKGKRVAKK